MTADTCLLPCKSDWWGARDIGRMATGGRAALSTRGADVPPPVLSTTATAQASTLPRCAASTRAGVSDALFTGDLARADSIRTSDVDTRGAAGAPALPSIAMAIRRKGDTYLSPSSGLPNGNGSTALTGGGTAAAAPAQLDRRACVGGHGVAVGTACMSVPCLSAAAWGDATAHRWRTQNTL